MKQTAIRGRQRNRLRIKFRPTASRPRFRDEFTSPPKIPDDRTLRLLDAIVACGKNLGLNLATRASGGASDGNRLAAAGLPNIDTLGVRGDRIHSPDEYMVIDSLVERAQLVALLLVKIAAGDIDPSLVLPMNSEVPAEGKSSASANKINDWNVISTT